MAVSAKSCAHIPEGVVFKEMACAPVAGVTALQGLQEHGKLQRGESILIHGASGGVGHLAVQMAKAAGAVVTAVCSSRNADLVRSLGADHVIPYDQQDIEQHKGSYDLILDVQGSLSPATMRRLGKRAVMIGFTTMGHFFHVIASHKLRQFPFKNFTAKANTADLEQVARMIRDGVIRIHIEKTYGHQQIPDAIRHVESMRTRGKVAVEWL
jgi:NADPH:quinone reductase-like Zn-dependent oxidoreductase